MPHGTFLAQAERYDIVKWNAEGMRCCQIAAKLEPCAKTVCMLLADALNNNQNRHLGRARKPTHRDMCHV